MSDLALETALAAPGSNNTLHVLDYGNETIKSYSVEYFPEMRYFDYELIPTNPALRNEAQAHFVALQGILESRTNAIDSAWDLVGREKKAKSIITDDINWFEKEYDYTMFFRNVVLSNFIDTSGIPVRRTILFPDGGKMIVEVEAFTFVNPIWTDPDLTYKILEVLDPEGNPVSLQNDSDEISSIIFEFRGQSNMEKWRQAFIQLGIPVISISKLQEFVQPDGTVEIRDCNSSGCTPIPTNLP